MAPADTPTEAPTGPFTSYLAPAVAAMIAAENAKYGGAVETAWCGTWDAERELVPSARLLFRGNNAAVPYARHDMRAGFVDVHSHPIHSPVFPSEQDIRAAAALADVGAGMLIVSWDCADGYLVRPPLAARGPAPKMWSLGRWSLMYLPRSKT